MKKIQLWLLATAFSHPRICLTLKNLPAVSVAPFTGTLKNGTEKCKFTFKTVFFLRIIQSDCYSKSFTCEMLSCTLNLNTPGNLSKADL